MISNHLHINFVSIKFKTVESETFVKVQLVNGFLVIAYELSIPTHCNLNNIADTIVLTKESNN